MVANRKRAFVAALACLAIACGGSKVTAKVPTLQVTVTFDKSVMVDQLRFEVDQNNVAIVKPTTRPLTAAGSIASGASVAIILPDSAVGNTVSVKVVGMLAGADVISGHTDNVIPFPASAVGVTVMLGRQLTSMTVTPSTLSTPIGLSQQLTATGEYSDGTSEDITDAATWMSQDATLAAVDNNAGTRGLVTGNAVGVVVVTATLSGQSASCHVTVTPVRLVSISVTPNPLLLPLGSTRGLKATATYSNRTTMDITATADWTSNDPNVATIGNTAADKGVVMSMQVGTVSVSATQDGVTATASVGVVVPALMQIIVEPTNARIAAGFTRRFFATGIYTDGSSEDITSSVTWSTSHDTLATISNDAQNRGELSALAQGDVQVIADKGSGSSKIEGQITATVSAATLQSINVTPVNQTVPKGSFVHFVATGSYSDGTTQDITAVVTWSVSPTNLATIDNLNQHGVADTKASGMGAGTVTAALGSINAATGLKVSAATLVSIMVSPTNPSIAKGTTVTLHAIGTYSDGSSLNIDDQVAWMSDMGTVATVSAGVVTGKALGSATIMATVGDKNGTTLVGVTTATLQSLAIAPSTPTLALGTSTPLKATGTYSDNSTQDLTTQVTWQSGDQNIATIGNIPASATTASTQGVLTAKGKGMVQISVSAMGVSGKITATITDATLVSIAISPTNPAAPNGTTQVFKATGTYTDGSTQELTKQAGMTWTSLPVTTASISNASDKGTATALALGDAMITASFTDANGTKTDTTKLTVTDATLVSIAITPNPTTVALGTTTNLVAIGTYSDKSTKPLTGDVTWSSTPASPGMPIIVVSNDGTDHGKVTTVAEGTSTVTAQLGSIMGTSTVKVTMATLKSIAITPDSSFVTIGRTRQMTATGTYSDGSKQVITTSVTWSVSNMTPTGSDPNALVIDVSAAGGATAHAVGTVTLTATSVADNISGTTQLTARAALLTSIAVSPTTATVAAGLRTGAFTAKGTYNNGTTQDISLDVTWSMPVDSMGKQDNSIATISNADDEEGVATGVAIGTTTVSATLAGVTGTAGLTVTAPLVKSISIEPSSSTVVAGMTTPLEARAHYSDNTTKIVTNMTSWSSANMLVATVDDDSNKGVCLGVSAGTVQITASFSSIDGATQLVVTAAPDMAPPDDMSPPDDLAPPDDMSPPDDLADPDDMASDPG